jgi:hypothetical protein
MKSYVSFLQISFKKDYNCTFAFGFFFYIKLSILFHHVLKLQLHGLCTNNVYFCIV